MHTLCTTHAQGICQRCAWREVNAGGRCANRQAMPRKTARERVTASRVASSRRPIGRADAVAPRGHRLVDHHLGRLGEAVRLGRLDRRTEQGRVDEGAGEGQQGDRAGLGKRVRLDDEGGARLAEVAGQGDRDEIAADHPVPSSSRSLRVASRNALSSASAASAAAARRDWRRHSSAKPGGGCREPKSAPGGGPRRAGRRGARCHVPSRDLLGMAQTHKYVTLRQHDSVTAGIS